MGVAGRKKGVVTVVEFVCEQCGTAVARAKGRLGRGRFCSRSCASQYGHRLRREQGRTARVPVTCDGCGEPMVIWRHEVGKSKLHFHDWACRKRYNAEHTEDMDRLRDLVWDRDGGRCTRCGSVRYLETHHMNGRRENRLENLTLLCKKCHVGAHIAQSGGVLLNGRRSRHYSSNSPASTNP